MELQMKWVCRCLSKLIIYHGDISRNSSAKWKGEGFDLAVEPVFRIHVAFINAFCAQKTYFSPRVQNLPIEGCGMRMMCAMRRKELIHGVRLRRAIYNREQIHLQRLYTFSNILYCMSVDDHGCHKGLGNSSSVSCTSKITVLGKYLHNGVHLRQNLRSCDILAACLPASNASYKCGIGECGCRYAIVVSYRLCSTGVGIKVNAMKKVNHERHPSAWKKKWKLSAGNHFW